MVSGPFGCLHKSARNRNCAGQKVDLLFFRSQTCTLRPRLHASVQSFALTNFVPWPPVRHGSVQILLQTSVVFTRVVQIFRSVFSLCCFTFAKQPGKHISRFQALTALSEQKIAWFGCLHESVRNRNRAGQKLDLLFSSLKLAHLAVQIFVQFLRSRVNARWDRASFCPCKNLSGPV